jgi:hypothetical protein
MNAYTNVLKTKYEQEIRTLKEKHHQIQIQKKIKILIN